MWSAISSLRARGTLIRRFAISARFKQQYNPPSPGSFDSAKKKQNSKGPLFRKLAALLGIYGAYQAQKYARGLADLTEQFAAQVEATDAIGGLPLDDVDDDGSDEEREIAFARRFDLQLDASRGHRSGRTGGITCHASAITLPYGQIVEVCTFRRADLPSNANGSEDLVIVINAGSIAAARPLALELARQADCSIVAYSHAGLHVPHGVRRPPPTHDSSGSNRSLLFTAMHAFKNLLLLPGLAYSVTGDEAPLFSDRALPPIPLRSDPTSDNESSELVSVLKHIGAEKAFLVGTGFNWMATMKAALRNEAYIAGLVLVDPYLPDFVPRVFGGDCIADMPSGAPWPRDFQVLPGVSSFVRGPPIAHATSPDLLKIEEPRDLLVAEFLMLANRLDNSRLEKVRPLYLSSHAALALGLPLHTFVPLGAMRAIRVSTADSDREVPLEEHDDEDPAERSEGRWEWGLGMLAMGDFVLEESYPWYLAISRLPLPIFASDLVTAAYLRSQV
jgi:pimeloyl-ACP methyl ester carboxylesterase